MSKQTLSALIAIQVLFAGIVCSSQTSNANIVKLSKSDQRVYISQAHMQFTLDLLSTFIAERFNMKTHLLDSFVVSPLSAQTVLMMLHLGAKGTTKAEISHALYLSKLDNNVTFSTTHEIFGNAIKNLLQDNAISNSLSIGNQVFLRKDLQIAPTYKLALTHYYGTSLTPTDFGRDSLRLINDFVAKQTKGLINNFLNTPPSPTTGLMAINALYFKGSWQYKFDERDTENDAEFHLTNGQRVKISMMIGKFPVAYGYSPSLKASIIELPYNTQRLGLFLLLPDTNNGLFRLVRTLNATSFTHCITSMRKSKGDEINVRIPKFDIESMPSLTTLLRNSLGLRTLFSNGEADLSGMFSRPSGPIQLNEFVHRAILKIDESGSIGVAATAAIAERIGSFSGKFFEADHPFLFFLTDKQSGIILFAGVYSGPKDHKYKQ
ncbi:Sar s 27 allergen (serpin-like protein 2) [Leptotrombidium deliense]|uniref:Sar s 27 allergen (Serpin-like protein 2) n=1 Tax=Leptotrombidium deliense TaxID=299467 RepID=A0A443SPE4_9ACAR|nr:Sar s 27 allergen (serpin-like protein 2) [Leptotrombidium deliense]